LTYRLYIDEVGNHDLGSSDIPNERFLTLFGVWIENKQTIKVIQPEMREIKREFFQPDPDERIVFHRKKITRYQGAFAVLYSDETKRRAFGERMLRAYEEWEYTAIAVTIDKREHVQKYTVWHYEPYHYCLEVLLERYVLFLHYGGHRGDVMIEARYPTVDRKLASSFHRIYSSGTQHIPADIIQATLTSGQLKIKEKRDDIAGLQLADLLAHPAQYDVLKGFGLVEEQESEYGRKIAIILNDSKYNRDVRTGKIIGYGKKLLP